MSDFQSVEVVLVVSDPNEAQELFERLEALKSSSGEVVVDDLEMNTELGGFKSKRVISLALVFAGGVANGVVGNAVYDTLKNSKTVQCIVGGQPVDKATAEDKNKLDAHVRSVAKPHHRKK